jgi:2-methylisocitrate lyase-like PEP mutase family enzyme
MKSDLLEKAERLRKLHQPGRPLVLVNAWDCASARIFEAAGSAAIATTSAGIAFSEGFADGQAIPPGRMLEAVARICRCVSLPVTADMEAGYGDSAGAMHATVSGVLEAGAVGLNLEDHVGEPADPLVDLSLQLEKIRAVRQAAGSLGVPVVLNARTDPYMRGVGTPDDMLAEAIRRGLAYRDAGADCVFVPGVTDRAAIGQIVRSLGCPVNVLAASGGPSVPELAALGVARVSMGSGPVRAAVTLIQRLAVEALAEGTYSALEGIIPHARMNALMSR